MFNARTLAISGLISVAFAAPAATADSFPMQWSSGLNVAQDVRILDGHSASPTPVVAADGGATVVGGTISQQESAAWAIRKFEDAGLAIPTIEIHFHQDSDSCAGHRGIFSSGLQRVDVCVEEPAVILHEIAHAWNHANLSEDQRSDYVAVGGFGSWDDPDTPWSDRGSEDAADTIAWALLDDPITGFTADGPIAQANAAYRLLTGDEAPRVLVEEQA